MEMCIRDRDRDIENKVTNFTRMYGTIWKTLGNNIEKKVKLFYKIMAIPIPVSYTHLHFMVQYK